MSGPRQVRFDGERKDRIGLPEAVMADVKSAAQLADAVEQAFDSGGRVLVTRLAETQHAGLPEPYRSLLDYDPVSRTAIPAGLAVPEEGRQVGILTAGTADVPVAREAARTLACYGYSAREIYDVGVAGLWRVMEHRETIAHLPVIIVCAGMEGALFSVVAGLTPGVVIAVPTSNGYGIARGGRVALQSALASCAPGLAVTNIDNGYGAACLAVRVLAAGAVRG